jgi:hypothetical protein
LRLTAVQPGGGLKFLHVDCDCRLRRPTQQRRHRYSPECGFGPVPAVSGEPTLHARYGRSVDWHPEAVVRLSHRTIGMVIMSFPLSRRLAMFCVATGLATLGLSGCHSGPSSAASAPSASGAGTTAATPSAAPATAAKVDPCALVTPAEVQEVTGKPDASPSDVPAGVYQSCSYTKAGVVVLVRGIGKAAFDKSAAANPGGVKPVPGIGQDAYSSGGALLVWQNGTEITISVTSDGSGGLDQAEQFAKAAVAQL